MSDINDGGHAFPFVSHECKFFSAGMTLRDYFAARMPGFPGEATVADVASRLGIPAPDLMHGPEFCNWFIDADARFRYMQADAMLKAREGR